ncbi:MAG: hypothetical protein EOP84_32245 [Verrucomicrobiaceae bacterium]|nr:MAG: hypothetical protein EOP84_32245 [Verrucomicrobiaceae bacterium]
MITSAQIARTPLESAARAAARASAACTEEDRQEFEDSWRAYVPITRAVLQSLREPSEVVRDALDNARFNNDVGKDELWRSLIDAMLRDDDASRGP